VREVNARRRATSTSSFGVISPAQANDPRFAQLALRLMF